MMLLMELTLEEHFEELEALSERAAVAETLEDQLAMVSKQFDAARRALGIVNRLTPGPTKAKHNARVMGFLNRIRSSMALLSSTIANYKVEEIQ